MSDLDEFDDDDPLPAMRMLAFTILWGAFVIASIIGYIIYCNIAMFSDLFDKYGWAIVLILLVIYTVHDFTEGRRRSEAASLDAARLDAIEKYGLVVVPPNTGNKYHVMHRVDGMSNPQFIGAGGFSVRAAIDSALLELFPPARRVGDQKEV